ncbi:MAG: asparagine synthase (glutamine-hydrolyzing) [Rhodobacteraceae bacterium]|nr:asparagine synthase (glutamine-hydrolyzing) [Paracoccaceae bacterium]
MKGQKMCGILFLRDEKHRINKSTFRKALLAQGFRGPDDNNIVIFPNFNAALGHVRLSVVDVDGGQQPLHSESEKFCIIFNGEIYNFATLAKTYFPEKNITSDTHLIVELYEKFGESAVPMLDGMFAFVIFCNTTGKVFAARDAFGIKPMFIFATGNTLIVSSETISIRKLIETEVCETSYQELRALRRTIPGSTLFRNISELQPGHSWSDKDGIKKWYELGRDETVFSEEKVISILDSSIRAHLMMDDQVEFTSLISGGVDSTFLTLIAKPNSAYTVGLKDSNEFEEVSEFHNYSKVPIQQICVSEREFWDGLEEILKIKDEPISVPNEVLIYKVCCAMPAEVKVVLTGEGADEIFFGYDQIFKTFSKKEANYQEDFILRYRYTKNNDLERFSEYVQELSYGKNGIEFLEDFFLHFHLPGLLRRADSAMMLARKEGRVPFVTKEIIEYMYRRPISERWPRNEPKGTLRQHLRGLGYGFVSDRTKLGFNAKPKHQSVEEHYTEFFECQKRVLTW